MPTPKYMTSWNHGLATLSANGGGLLAGVTGTVTVTTHPDGSGVYAMHTQQSGASCYASWTLADDYCVGRVYVYIKDNLPTGSPSFIEGVNTDGNMVIQFNVSEGKFQAGKKGVTGGPLGPVVAVNTLYKIEWRFFTNATTHTIEWWIDDVEQTDFSISSRTAVQMTALRVGAVGAYTSDYYYTNLFISTTQGDYPIGSGVCAGLRPTSDGTHNNGTNILETSTGADIDGSSVFAFSELDSDPWSSTLGERVQQNGSGTGNYVAVNFEDMPAASQINGVRAILQYRAASTTLNEGGCQAINEDNTKTVIWGGEEPNQADYSESSMFYKSVQLPTPGGGWDQAAVNAIYARLGYSGDTSPMPYWCALMLEVDYVEGGAGPVEESVTLARSAGITAASQVSVYNATTLTKYKGITASSLATVYDPVSLAKYLDITTVSQVSVYGIITLTKYKGIMANSLATVLDSVSFAKYLGIMVVSQVGVYDVVALARYLGITTIGEPRIAELVTLTREAEITAEGIRSTIEENVTLAKYARITTIEQVIIVEFIVLGRNVDIIVLESIVGAIVEESVTLVKKIFVTQQKFAIEESTSLAKGSGISAFDEVNIQDVISLAKSLSTAEDYLLEIAEFVTLTKSDFIIETDELVINEQVSLNKFSDITIIGDVPAIEESVNLAKDLGISAFDKVNIQDSSSFIIFNLITPVDETLVKHGVILAKVLDITAIGDIPSIEENVNLAKSLQISSSEQIDIQDVTSLNKILSISELDEPLIEDFLSLVKSNEILISSQLDAQELVSLLKFKAIGVDSQVEVNDSLILALLKDISVLEYIPGGVVEESITLAKQLSVTQKPPALEESLDLVKNLGISVLDEVNIQDSISLAKSLDVVENYLLEIQELITLTKVNTIISIDEVVVQDQISLSKFLDIAVIGDISGTEENVNLAKSLQTAFSEQLNGQNLVSLNKILSISELDEVVIGDSVTFTKFAATVSNSDVIIQELVSLLKTKAIGTDTQAETYGSLTFAIFKAIPISEETQGQYAETVILGRYAALTAFEEGISHVSESVILGRINSINIIGQLKIDDFLTLVRSNGMGLIGNCQINNSVLLSRLMILSIYPNCYIYNYLTLSRFLTLNAISQLVINEATSLSKLNQLDLIDSRYLVESVALGYSNLLSLDNNLDIRENIELGRIDIVTLITVLFGYNAISFNQFKSIIAEPPSLYVYNDGNHSVGVLFRDKRAEVVFRDKRVEALFRDKRVEALFRDRRGSVPWRDKRGD